jgi:hypothetical protein
MFILAAGEVDIVRIAVAAEGLRREEMVARRGVKIARMRAITTMKAAKVLVKKITDAVVECWSALLVVLVSGIRRDRNQLHRPRAWFIYTSLAE